MSDRKTLISIDFWNTLVNPPTGGEGRKLIRYRAVNEVASENNVELTVENFEASLKRLSDHFNKVWKQEQRTPEADEIIRDLMRRLDITANDEQIKRMADAFIYSLLESPPRLMPGVRKWIPRLARKYTLAIISDTMVTPGKILRKYLDQQGLLEHFSAFAFSDEVGSSKPHPAVYKKVLQATGCKAQNSWHIGDIQRTDIAGAKSVGMHALLYAANLGEEDIQGNTADKVVYSWEEAGLFLLNPKS